MEGAMSGKTKNKHASRQRAKERKARNRKARAEKFENRNSRPKRIKKSDTRYVFEVALKYQPEICRTIALAGHVTLDDLHWEIFKAFDREEEHLYSFYVPRIVNGRRSRTRDHCDEYSSSMCCEPDPFLAFYFGRTPPRDAALTRIDQIGLARSLKFEYLFDFGDSWHHVITVKQIKQIEADDKFGLIEKHGESPPQYEFDNDDEFEMYNDEVA
jgi:Plasmid pRiA4b ORF-3-like protein